MTSANSTQVGGTHYTADYQHWDFVNDAGLGYFPGQISKYVCRHSKKSGAEDLRKAAHYAHKYIEILTAEAETGTWSMPLRVFSVREGSRQRLLEANKHLGAQESEILSILVHAVTPGGLRRVCIILDEMLGAYPQAGYVRQ